MSKSGKLRRFTFANGGPRKIDGTTKKERALLRIANFIGGDLLNQGERVQGFPWSQLDDVPSEIRAKAEYDYLIHSPVRGLRFFSTRG